MALLHKPRYDDRQLERYLLGLLPPEDTERVDELSVVDEDTAWRLRAVENDLVDGYVSGTLERETRDRFEAFYLSSPRRRAKLKLAESLAAVVGRQPEREEQIAPTPVTSGSTAPRATGWNWWALAAAAAVLVMLVGGALFVQDLRVRTREVEAQSAVLDQRARELERQLEEQRRTNAGSAQEVERLRNSLALALAQQSAVARPGAAPGPLAATALLLLPQTRAVGPIASLIVPAGAASVNVALRLESNDFPRYQASNQIVWRSGPLAATSLDHQGLVSVTVPASVLKPQHYSFELAGRRGGGSSEIIGSYAVQVAGR